MLDLTLLRRDLAQVIERLERRKSPQPFLDVERYAVLESERKTIQSRTEELQARRNALSKQIGQRKGAKLDAGDLMTEVAGIGDALRASAERLETIQGELSALLGSKSFGENKASNLETQAGMPAGYLVSPLSGGAATNPPISETAFSELRMIVALMAQALAASTPIAGRELAATSRKKLGAHKGTLSGELVKGLESELADLADTFPRKSKARGSR